MWAGKREESEGETVCVLIRCGAGDVVIEVRCWETSGEPGEWSVRARGVLGKNTKERCYSLNRAILLHLVSGSGT